MKKLLLGIIMLQSVFGYSQTRKTENVIVVTLDGMRWQEIFGGVDSALMNNKHYTRDPESIAKMFWNDDVNERRKKLFPFLWTTVESNGQLYGNRNKGNYVNNANPYWFSYPGYNEIFTGYPDTTVNSNDKIYNKNENVLEYINKQKGYKGKVAAFSTWDVFPYILNAPRSHVYVNADVDSLNFSNDRLKLINDWQFLTTKPIGVRPDVITYIAAREYLKAYKPKVLYIAFDETDDFAHGGMYDQYLGSAHAEDKMISDLWTTIQAMPEYKNKTTLLVTCDHGRGDKNKDQWRDHGQKVEDANQIWFVAMGPDTKHKGEVTEPGQLYQKQFASTIAALLGMEFKADHPIAEPVVSVLNGQGAVVRGER
jgi:hypothetical protein